MSKPVNVEQLRAWLKNGDSDPNDFADALDEIDRLRAALRSIVERHGREDKGAGFTRGGGLAWAMADDARQALDLPVDAKPPGVSTPESPSDSAGN